MAVFLTIMTISTDFAISNSMPSFAPKYWLDSQILVAMYLKNHIKVSRKILIAK